MQIFSVRITEHQLVMSTGKNVHKQIKIESFGEGGGNNECWVQIKSISTKQVISVAIIFSLNCASKELNFRSCLDMHIT